MTQTIARLLAPVLVCAAAGLGAQSSGLSPGSERAAPGPPEQPIPFSHKLHLGFGLECVYCHSTGDTEFDVGIPEVAECMTCHASIETDSPAIEMLAAHHETGTPVPWVRIYRLPSFVWFSHRLHYEEAGLGCELCHGPVADRDVMVKEMPATSMEFCMECHAQKGARNGCGVCHNPQ